MTSAEHARMVRVRVQPGDGEVGALVGGLGAGGRFVPQVGQARDVLAVAVGETTSSAECASEPPVVRVFRCPYTVVRGTFSMAAIWATVCLSLFPADAVPECESQRSRRVPGLVRRGDHDVGIDDTDDVVAVSLDFALIHLGTETR
ncbi:MULTISPECIES: hypothetical protein [Rhodococcus]|uniref:Uncharacterized protein n=2 Tax=Rhodococcus opacus TaxID=37919 RepID=C1BDC8_RHOOB|nr:MULTISPECIES: hypothetical protein [Rhodococcus]QQZ18192.1 hypothetical protein GO592_38620 [Rhodococcus sp. 21391]UOT08108.1 hypothetical protein MPY17_37715 [Rhodococcus opacus]BAH55872.1 hypothetical protein ROP_pROB01-03730 [Rhodococcus opacus B4]